MIISIQCYESPCGSLLLGAAGGYLCLCDWIESSRHSKTVEKTASILHAGLREESSGLTARAIRQLNEYFSGSRQEFDLPLLDIGTPFQKIVRQILMTVAYGTTLSYSGLARRLGLPGGARAVANAVAANPISIFMPCHRIVGARGRLGGYAGGPDAKRYLLDLEREKQGMERLLTVN